MADRRPRTPIASKRDLAKALDVLNARGVSFAGITILPGGGMFVCVDPAVLGLRPANDDEGGAAWDAALDAD
ncbi:MAG TPA: hypothetical protein VGR32_10100 [Brevundimonas sp.]|nr:hypothetical protein [Brevundimonas sp.]